MSDWQGYRPSPNVQTLGPDPIRRNWLTTATFAPEDYRAAHGLSTGISPTTRQTAFEALGNEMPYVDPSRDYLDVGRPTQLPSFPDGGLAALGASSPPPRPFLQQSDDAMLGRDVGNALSGRPSFADPVGSALAAALGMYVPLGGGSR